MINSARLTPQPLDKPLSSLPQPSLRYDTKHARLSFLNLILNQSVLSSGSVIGSSFFLIPKLFPLLLSQVEGIGLCQLPEISDGFNKPRPGSRTILSTIEFSKAFDSVWHPALFHKLISASLPPCFARWTQSFLSDRRASVVYQNHKSRSFRVRRGVPQESVLGPVFFSLFINDLPTSLLSSVSCSLYTDDLAIWSSSPLVPTAAEASQGALFRLECWSEYWCLPLNPSKCEASFFSVNPHQANLQPNLLLLGSRIRFNLTPHFLGVTFDRTLSFS